MAIAMPAGAVACSLLGAIIGGTTRRQQFKAASAVPTRQGMPLALS